MRKSALFAACGVLLLLFLFPGGSMATFIDFRFAPFESSANNSASYSRTIESLTLTFTPLGPATTKNLYWDSTDGFGVQAGGYEADEIEYPESLRITFSIETFVHYFDLTDFFYESRSGNWYEERGQWSLDNLIWYDFSQTDHSKLPDPKSNGEFRLNINQEVTSIWFTAPKSINGQDHEFSVAGVRVAVPEPATMLLLGFGLVGLAIAGRRSFRK